MIPLLRKALFPGGLVFLACVAYLMMEAFDRLPAGIGAAETAKTYGLVVYGAGLALAWVFHRSRAFTALALLAVVDIAVTNSAPVSGLRPHLTVSLLLLLGVLAVVRDRGVLSRLGGAQALLSASFLAFVTWSFQDSEQLALLTAGPQIRPLTAVQLGLPLLAWGIVVFTAVALAYGLIRYRGAVERSFAWGGFFLLLSLHPAISTYTPVGEAATSLFFVATGLTIALGVVETSYVMAYRDELTGLMGRRALMQYLDGIQGTYTVAMVDVDHFKNFNDKHGHDVGDQVLKLVATMLGNAPGGGKAYRYGGEEFTLLYPGRTREEALPHLEAVRESIEEARFAVRSWKRPRKKPKDGAQAKQKKPRKPRTLSVTVSIGMADTTAADPAPHALLKKADQALYRAKTKGRNQVSK